MKGGGLPLFGSVKNLMGLTNKKVCRKRRNDREFMFS